MACTVRIFYDAIGIDGTPSAGTNYHNQVYEISVADGDYIGEFVAAGGGFGPCPSVMQFILQARKPSTGEIVGAVTSSTCHDVRFLKYENTCPPSEQLYDCINGQCAIKTQYNTPGLYKSLADCQAVCTNGGACASGKHCVDPTTFCPDGKVCIDQGEFASIEALISKINSEVC